MTRLDISISTDSTPSSAPTALRQSASMISFNGHAGVVNSTVKRTLPSSTAMSFTMFRVTMSRPRSGSFTALNASNTASRVNIPLAIPSIVGVSVQ